MNEEKTTLFVILSGWCSEKPVAGKEEETNFHKEMKGLETANK